MANSTGGDQVGEAILDLVQGVARIPLFRRKGNPEWVTVDLDDLHLVAPYRWHALLSASGNTHYAQTTISASKRTGTPRRAFFMHRLILDAPEGDLVDHCDGDGLNNRRSNLRLASKSLNGANRVNRNPGTNPYRGSRWVDSNQAWSAYITVNNKRTYLGLFEDATSAALAYDDAARLHFGEFARTNFTLEEAAALPRTPRRRRPVKHGARMALSGCRCETCAPLWRKLRDVANAKYRARRQQRRAA